MSQCEYSYSTEMGEEFNCTNKAVKGEKYCILHKNSEGRQHDKFKKELKKYIINNEKNNTILIYGIKFDRTPYFLKYDKIDKNIYFIDSELPSKLELANKEFLGGIGFVETSIGVKLNVKNCVFNSKVIIRECYFTDFIIENIVVNRNNKFIIEDTEITNLKFSHNKIKNNLVIKDCKISLTKINDTYINNLTYLSHNNFEISFKLINSEFILTVFISASRSKNSFRS